ncbi:WRKY transcription factor 22-like [Curcuma longa]|uniref:WRKY transcription factor 22-like n=1 Tax=Curcuma longa TaxID=136217 RepID=UPI003D9E9BA1
MDNNDWDLFAVVRGCLPAPPTPVVWEEEEEVAAEAGKRGFSLDRVMPACGVELDELSKLPFRDDGNPLQFSNQTPAPAAMPSYVVASVLTPLVAVPYQFQQHPRPAATQRPAPPSQTPRSKRKRNQQKKVVCQVPADGVSSDLWAWRKYGQKPIKGSPYPRSYYRCSSSKGCQARKQVERSRAEPAMLLITYTAEHNHPVPTHRNSLSGSTRQKAPKPASSAAPASPPSPASPSHPDKGEDGEEEEPVVEEDEEEEEMLTVADVEMMREEDMLFLGMKVADAGSSTETTAGANKLVASLALLEEDEELFSAPNWLANNATFLF